MINTQTLRIIACPNCKNTLNSSSEGLFCNKCNKTYPVKSGIVDFLTQDNLQGAKLANAEYYDKESNFYDRIHLHVSRENKLFRRIVRDRINISGGKVLDIGSGTGFVLNNFTGKNQFFCIDISFNMLRRITEEHNQEIIWALRADAESLPISDESIDIAVISSTLHHLSDWQRCLSETQRVLKPEGQLVIFHEPNLIRFQSLLFRIMLRITHKITALVTRKNERERKEKREKYAQTMFGLDKERPIDKMREFTINAEAQDGFNPLSLLDTRYYKNIRIKTYYARNFIYHKLMSLLFPGNGELLYITAVKKKALNIEKINQEVFGRDSSIAEVSRDLLAEENDYFSKMVKIRLDLMKKYMHSNLSDILDLCCGTGVYLFRIKDRINRGVGIDYVRNMIFEAQRKKRQINAENLQFIIGNAKQIPCKEEKFDLIYSFSSLYYIPEIDKVIMEIARLLKVNGVAILEFGNLMSLNTLVCRATSPECAMPSHIKISEIREILRDAGLQILEWKRFQILPLWGDKPKILKPLLLPLWRKILQQEINGRMLDEWISNLPLIRNFTFRQMIICRKQMRIKIKENNL